MNASDGRQRRLWPAALLLMVLAGGAGWLLRGTGTAPETARYSATGEAAPAATETPEAPEGAPVHGTLELAYGWAGTKRKITLRGMDRANWKRQQSVDLVGPPDEVQPFSTAPLPAGRYRAIVGPMLYQTTFEHTEPAEPVAITVPAPVAVTVRVVDAATGGPLAASDLYWSVMVLEGRIERHIRFDAHRDPLAPGTFTFHAAPGAVTVHASGKSHVEEAQSFDLTVGPVEHVFRLRRFGRVVVRVRTPTGPWKGRALEVHLLSLDGGGAHRELYLPAQPLTIAGRPGDWTVQLLERGVDGFRIPEPIEVRVESGEDTEAVLELLPE